MHRSIQIQETALNNAVASVELEGYSVSENEKTLCMEFVNGKMTKEQFINTVLERCRV